MSKYMNNYNISIIFEDQNSKELDPYNIALNLTDNIHSFYNNGQLVVNDGLFLLQESLLLNQGAKVSIDFGFLDNSSKCDYVISKPDLSDPIRKGYLAGLVNLRLINNYFIKQEIKSKSYKNKISAIVKQVLSSDFKNTNIDETDGTDIWYQDLKTNASYIENVLKNNAYSYKSNDSPFYAFIDNSNTFNFVSFKTMMNSSPVADLVYSYTDENIARNVITLKKIGSDIKDNFKSRTRDVFKIDKNTGDLISSSDIISNKNKSSKKLPYLNDNYKAHDFYNFLFEGKNPAEINRNKGKLNSSVSKDMIAERFEITVPYNPAYLSGKTVNLKIYTLDGNGKIVESSNYTDKYLIEQSSLVFDGYSNTTINNLIIGRQREKELSSYILSSKLF